MLLMILKSRFQKSEYWRGRVTKVDRHTDVAGDVVQQRNRHLRRGSVRPRDPDAPADGEGPARPQCRVGEGPGQLADAALNT